MLIFTHTAHIILKIKIPLIRITLKRRYLPKVGERLVGSALCLGLGDATPGGSSPGRPLRVSDIWSCAVLWPAGLRRFAAGAVTPTTLSDCYSFFSVSPSNRMTTLTTSPVTERPLFITGPGRS